MDDNQNIMKLETRAYTKYVCPITDFIDSVSTLDKDKLPIYAHYVSIFFDTDWTEEYIAIRLPGYTCGYIKQDENHIIQEIELTCLDRYGEMYPDDINEQLKQFVGVQLVMSVTA